MTRWALQSSALALSALVLASVVHAAGPTYPRTLPHSCWGRSWSTGSPKVWSVAPSVFPPAPARPTAPGALVRRLLARLGDDRFVVGVKLGPPPAFQPGSFGITPPPADALWATLVRTPIRTATAAPSPDEIVGRALADWEAGLVVGALRDDLCAAGGRPLVGASGRSGNDFSSSGFAYNQRFANPSPGAFGQLVADAGRRYGFTVVSLSLLRPLQTAPVLFVETGRDRTAFMHDLPAIENMLDPGLDQPLQSPLARKTPLAFEGLFFEVRDAQGPFLAVWNARRGAAWGDQWSWLTATLRSSHG